jgi:flagella basal body P-ring formation protein FlgA
MFTLLLITICLEIAGTPVDEARIRKAVEEYIYALSGASRKELVVELRGRLPKLIASTSEYSISVGLEAMPKIRGYASIPIEIVSHGKVDAKTIVAVCIRRFDTVFVTSRQLQRHDALTAGDLTPRWMETTNAADDLVSDVRWLNGKRSVRMIAESTLLSRTMLENIPAVKVGDPLTIIAGSHSAVVKVSGIARQDGCIGDIITVQKSGSHERFQAKVISEHAVELRFDEGVSPTQKD